VRTAGILVGTLALISTGAAVAAARATPAEVGEIRSALAERNINAAGVALDRLIEARLPPKETGRPDPLLDRLEADYLVGYGQVAAAVPILRRIVADPAEPDLPRYQLALAAYDENAGSWDEAQAGYRRIAAYSKTPPATAVAATLGLARIQMATDPVAALTLLASLDRARVSADTIWEVDLLMERAAAMAGTDQSAVASKALERSWAETPAAALGDGAVARVSQDRALAAGRAGDRKALVALLAVDRTNRLSNNGQFYVTQGLPLCGTGGITPQDMVVVDVVHQAAPGRPAVTLAWASRPGIARPFLIAAGRSGALGVPDGQAASFALRCRSVPSAEYAVRVSVVDDLMGWMTSKGVYPKAGSDGGGVASLATELAQRQARYGPNSVMLLPALFRATTPGVMNLGDADGRRQAAQNLAHITTILQQNNAPAALTALWRLSAIGFSVAAQTRSQDDAQAEAQAILLQLAQDPTMSLDTAYTLAAGAAAGNGTVVPVGFRNTMLTAVLDLMKRRAPAGDPRIAALALQLHQLRNEIGDAPGAAASIAGLGLPSDACALSDPLPRYVSSNVSADDYPGDLVFTSLAGVTQAEFALDPSGNAREPRLLLSDPPFAFDQIALTRLPTVRYDPARFAGRPASCRGATQALRWQLPQE
jgi:hypothetical protein